METGVNIQKNTEYPVNEGVYCGRRMILSDETEVTRDNILEVLGKALPTHRLNRQEIEYLWNYYRSKQPILHRTKQVRPEINNRIVENRANEIVAFKSAYLMGEPVVYVGRGDDKETMDSVTALNEYMFEEEKSAKDKEISDWFHICGTAFRMVLPDPESERDECPFEIYTLDPRNTFVVYNNGLGNKPILGVMYVVDADNITHYSCYTKNEYFEIASGHDGITQYLSPDSGVIAEQSPHILGGVPIVEYPLNVARMGAFEIVLPLLDAINTVDSNRIDGIEQFVQSLMLFHNVDISSDDFKALREEGAIKFKDIDPQFKADIQYITSSLQQGDTQTLVNHLYQVILTICGMPNRNGGSSTSDTGTAVIYRDGFSAAESRAKDTELMFRRSEKEFLKIVLNICSALGNVKLKVGNIDIRFTRRNYEGIAQKAQVLDLMLKNEKVHPRYAFEYSNIFPDPDLAYEVSEAYAKAQAKEAEKKAQKQFEQEMALNEQADNSGDDSGDGVNSQKRESSRTEG